MQPLETDGWVKADPKPGLELSKGNGTAMRLCLKGRILGGEMGVRVCVCVCVRTREGPIPKRTHGHGEPHFRLV